VEDGNYGGGLDEYLMVIKKRGVFDKINIRYKLIKR
jgi:hypothetical protein